MSCPARVGARARARARARASSILGTSSLASRAVTSVLNESGKLANKYTTRSSSYIAWPGLGLGLGPARARARATMRRCICVCF